MGRKEELTPQGDKIRKAVQWISETLNEHPEMTRVEVIREAEMRFDLSPSECEFLDSNFS